MIVPREIELLHERGVARVFSPDDGQRLGLPGMINVMIRECDVDLAAQPPASYDDLYAGDTATLARTLTLAEAGRLPADLDLSPRRTVPVLGITGTGGSGKSSLTDELVRRFRLDQEDKLRIAVLAVDPTRRKGGGALLGDRIRMNSITGENVFFRSMATRGADGGLPERLSDVIAVLKAAGFDLVIVETPGIGQGDAAIVPFVDRSLYVMTPEFGAASQLEKIDMLDFADAVAINKFERRGAEDARRDVGRQLVRNREEFGATWEDMPVFGTSAATFNDEGVTALYQHLRGLLLGEEVTGRLPHTERRTSAPHAAVIPPGKVRYLADVAETVRDYHDATATAVDGRAGPPAPAHRARARRRRRSTRRSPTPRRRCPPPTPSCSTAGRRPSRTTRATSSWSACGTRSCTRRSPARRCRAAGSRASRSPATPRTPSCCASCAARTCPAGSRSRRASSTSSARARTRPGCSRARATPSAPTAASRSSRRTPTRSGCPPRSTR